MPYNDEEEELSPVDLEADADEAALVVEDEDKPVVIADEEEEPEIVVKDDKWKVDPKNLLDEEDPDAAERGRRTKKKIEKLTAAGHELARQRDAIEADRQAAIKFAQQERARALKAEQEAAKYQAELYDSMAAHQEALTASAAKRWEAAANSGATEVASKINQELADSAAKALQYKEKAAAAKAALVSAEEKAKAVPVQQQQQVQAPPSLDPNTQAWISVNPWFGLDATGQGKNELSNYALRVHEVLKAKDIPLGSDKYFELLDRSMKAKFPSKFGEAAAPRSPQTVRRQASPAATQQVKAGKVTLNFTKGQIEQAKAFGFTTPRQLLAYHNEILKEGKQ